jgi:hypothetical protein
MATGSLRRPFRRPPRHNYLLEILMTVRKAFGVAVVVLVSLAGVVGWAQDRRVVPPQGAPPMSQTVLSGENVGVILTGQPTNGTVEGTVVVKLNGQWVRVVGGPKVVPAAR